MYNNMTTEQGKTTENDNTNETHEHIHDMKEN